MLLQDKTSAHMCGCMIYESTQNFAQKNEGQEHSWRGSTRFRLLELVEQVSVHQPQDFRFLL